MTTILNDRTDLHLARLHEALTWSRPTTLQRRTGDGPKTAHLADASVRRRDGLR
jgi:hypothetical protein